jgi:UDP-GlcNAc:undecaprenyl-phosphate GlcNAc-1-phosphate transferase
MVVLLLAFASSLLLALALTPPAGRLARRLGALDHALSPRKQHIGAVPRTGGLAIAAAFAGGLAASAAAGGPAVLQGRMAAVLGAGAFALAVGVADDVFRLSPRVKLCLQLAAAGLACAGGLRVEAVATPFGEAIPLHGLALPFTLLFLVGAMNAMNLIDGLDGLAGGIATTAACAAVAVALSRGDVGLAVLGASTAGACIGFLRHNLRPGRIFMGDGGSLFLGLVLAAGSIPEAGEAARGVDLLAPVVALGVPILDTALAIARRAARGAPLFAGDRDHLHHRLLAAGFTPRRAAVVLVALSAVHGAVAVGVAGATGLRPVLLLLGLVLVDASFLRALGYARPGFLGRLADERRRHADLRGVVRTAATRLDAASNLEEVQEVLASTAAGLGARRARLLLAGEARPGLRGSRTRLGLRGERPGGGSLEIRWRAEAAGPDLPALVAAEFLCARVAGTVRRLQKP